MLFLDQNNSKEYAKENAKPKEDEERNGGARECTDIQEKRHETLV